MIIDLWEWGEGEGQEPSQQHFNAISQFSSTCRQTGTPHTIMRSATHVWGHALAQRWFSKLPPNAVRTRWGSCDSIEQRHKETQPYLERTLRHAFAHDLEQRDRRRTKKEKTAAALAAADADVFHD